MTENSTRSAKEPTARLQKSASLNNGRCDTPDSAGSRTGSGSPVPVNAAASSPTSTTSSGAVPANSPTAILNSNFNHAGNVSQRPFPHRGRYGGYGHGHHTYYSGRQNQHVAYNPSQCRPSSPPFSKPLLDFMISQWQTFEISYNRRDHALADDGPPASPRIPGPANSPYRQPRHSHQGGGWNGVNRRFSDNGHHVNHTDVGDFQSNSGDMACSGRRFRGLGAHIVHPHHFSNNDQPWQRGHVVGRRKSPNGLSNRTSGPRSSLPFSGPAPAPHHHQQQSPSGVLTSSPPPPTDRAALVNPAPAAAIAPLGGAKSMDGAEPVSSSGVSALSERLVGVVAPKLATAAAYKDRLSPSESQAQRPNGSSSSAVTVGADAHPMLPSAAVTVLPAKTQATCQELTKAMNADESMEEKLQAGSRRRTPTSLSASGGNLSPTVLSNALVGGSAGSRPISLTHVATRDDVRGGGDGSSAMSNSTDNCSVLRAVVELLPAGGCRLINRHPASARAESISISVGSSSFGSLDQGDALSGGDQFWTPDPPSSPTTASNAPASPNAGCGASAASSTTSSSVSSQFFHQNVSGQQNASTSPGSSPLGESGPPTGTFDKSQQHHQNKQRLSAAPIR